MSYFEHDLSYGTVKLPDLEMHKIEFDERDKGRQEGRYLVLKKILEEIDSKNLDRDQIILLILGMVKVIEENIGISYLEETCPIPNILLLWKSLE